MKIYKDIEQRTPEWHKIRNGVLTASNFTKVITPTGKLSNSETSRGFIKDLVIDCLIDQNPHKEDSQRAMSYKFSIRWGNDHEPIARDWFRNNVCSVETVGFVKFDKNIPLGCSPDGLIPSKENEGWESGLEIKCPSIKAHVEYLDSGVLPPEYNMQVHGSMAVTGLNSWYFLSYYPAKGVKQFLLRVERDDFTEKIKQSLMDFVDLYRSEFSRISAIIK